MVGVPQRESVRRGSPLGQCSRPSGPAEEAEGSSEREEADDLGADEVWGKKRQEVISQYE